jgi:hypothetical protein
MPGLVAVRIDPSNASRQSRSSALRAATDSHRYPEYW